MTRAGSTSQALVRDYQVVTDNTPVSTEALKRLTVMCPPGKKVMGGAWEIFDSNGTPLRGFPTHDAPLMSGEGWTVGAKQAPGGQSNWYLQVRATCADSSLLAGYEVVRAAGVRWVQEAEETPYVTCPAGKLQLGGGWSITGASGEIVEGYVRGGSMVHTSQQGWSAWVGRPAPGVWEPWNSYAYVICANSFTLPGQQIVVAETGYELTTRKQLQVSCPVGKRGAGIGWIGLDEGNYYARIELDVQRASADANTWLVAVTHEAYYFPNSFYYPWKLQLKLVCVDATAPSSCGPTVGSMTFTSEGPTQWPAACWRPFDVPGNPFNKLIPTTAKKYQLHHNTVDIVKQLLAGGRPGEFLGRLDGNAGEPTYYAQPTDPRYIIRCRDDPFGAPNGHCRALEGRAVRIPRWALPEGGEASTAANNADAHMTIIDRNEGVQYDFWQVQVAPLPVSPTSTGVLPELTISAGNRIYLDSTGRYAVGEQTTGSFGIGRNGTAGYFAGQLGKVRLEELQAEQINHALFMLVPCHNTFEGGTGVVYPATGPGGTKCTGELAGANEDAPAMGAHFFYDRTPNEIDAIRRANGSPLPAWKRTLLKALSRYGAFLGDTAGGWGFDQESSYQYRSVPNGARRWYDYGSTQQWQHWVGPDGVAGSGDDRYYGRLYDLVGASGSQASDIEDRALINFETHLKVLKPCVAQGTCR